MPFLDLLARLPHQKHQRVEWQPDPQRLLEEIIYRTIEIHTVAALPGAIS